CAMSQEDLDDAGVAVIRSDVQAGVSVSVASELHIHLDAPVQEEVDRFRAAVCTGQREPVQELHGCRIRAKTVGLAEEVRYDVDPSQTGRSWKIQRGSAAHEVSGRLGLAVREAGANERVLVTGASREIHSRAVAEQDVDHLPLDAGNRR